MPPEEYASVRALRENRLVGEVEMGVERPAGVAWISVSAMPARHPDYGVVIAFVDITERKQAEAARQTAEQAVLQERQRLQHVIDGTRAGTWEWQVQTGALTLNQRWAEIVGYRLDELEPVSIQASFDLAHPDDLKRSDAAVQAHLTGRAP